MADPMIGWLIVVALLLLVMLNGSRRTDAQGGSDWRLVRMEEKVDQILEHLKLEYHGQDKVTGEVKALLKERKKSSAIRAFRFATGAGPQDAQHEIDRIESQP